MTDRRAETKANLLATLQTLSPPLEKLMAERLALRRAMQSAQSALSDAEKQIDVLRQVRDVRIPRYIATAKSVALATTAASLSALTLSLFSDLFAITITAPLFVSLLIPLWLVDRAERHFGRWHLHLNGARTFIRNDG